MPYDLKYGAVLTGNGGKTHGSSENAIPLNESDEPVFILRSQDQTSVYTLNAYKDACINAGCHPDHIHSIEQVIDEFIGWQNRHSTKLPD